MTNEEMQSTMQFLLEQQAQFAARMQMDEERIARVESAMLLLTELARSADERMDTFDERTHTFDARLSASTDNFDIRLNALAASFDARLNALTEGFDSRLNTLNEKIAELAEVQSEGGRRLNALLKVVERYLSDRNGNPQG